MPRLSCPISSVKRAMLQRQTAACFSSGNALSGKKHGVERQIYIRRDTACHAPANQWCVFFFVMVRQHRTKSVWRLCTPSACKFPVIFHKNAREYIKYSLRFLFHLTKNLTTHLSHNLCVVLPWIESCESPIGNSRAFFVCIWGENIYTAQFGEIYVYNSLLDTAEEVWYNNKAVARERKTRKLVDSRNRETDREIDRGAVEVVQEKFTWQNVWSVVEWIGWLF